MPNADSFRVYDNGPDVYQNPTRPSVVESYLKNSIPTRSSSADATRNRVTFRDQTSIISGQTGDQLPEAMTDGSTASSPPRSDGCVASSEITTRDVQNDPSPEIESLNEEPLNNRPESVVDNAIVQERDALRQELALLKRRSVSWLFSPS